MATTSLKNETKLRLEKYCLKHKKREIDIVTKGVEKEIRNG